MKGNGMTATKPVSDSPLDGYWGSDNSQHVNFSGTDGHVHELYIVPGAGWVDNDLTALAGPNASNPNSVPRSQLHGFWGGDNSQQVNYVGVDFLVHRLSIEPNGPGWVDRPAPVGAAISTSLPGYWGTDGSKHVFFVAAGFSGEGLHELYTAPGAADPVDHDLSALTGAVLPAQLALDAYWGSDSSQHVNFIGTDGDVHELYIVPGAGWVDNDLTALAAAEPPALQSGLSGYWGDDNSVHVFYFGAGTDNHVYQLRIFPGGPGWVWEDLTSLADGIVPMVSRALHSYLGTNQSQHVNYIGSGNHVHELYRAAGADPTDWRDNDLTVLAGAVPPHQNTALDSYWGSDSSQHVFFIGADGDVHELYIKPGSGWVDNNLTQLA
jgi:hypothetical protein